MKYFYFLVLLVPACVDALYNCDYTPKCLEIGGGDDFIFSEEEIKAKCDEFKKFQVCLDEWGNQCLGPQKLQTTRVEMEKPLQMLKKMCTDAEYRKGFIQEIDSLMKIKDDWKKCQKELEEDVKKASVEKDKNEMTKGFCCGFREFQDCSDDLCEGKCTPEAKKILADIIAMTKESISVTCPASVTDDCPESEGKNKNSSSMKAFNAVYLALSMIISVMLF